jgi:LmbE family N-acetylglucosaminyl deacetylase
VVLDCVYPLARDHLAFPELPREYEPHSVREVYYSQWERPSLVVDISETMELKLSAIRCHASQIGDVKDFAARIRNRAAAWESLAGNFKRYWQPVVKASGSPTSGSTTVVRLWPGAPSTTATSR